MEVFVHRDGRWLVEEGRNTTILKEAQRHHSGKRWSARATPAARRRSRRGEPAEVGRVWVMGLGGGLGQVLFEEMQEGVLFGAEGMRV